MLTIHIDEELQLTILEKPHAPRLFELTENGRDYLREWLPWVDFTKEVEDSQKFIDMGLQQYVSNDGFQLGIEYKGEIVGTIGLHHINWANKNTSIGYWLGQDYQGHGIMTRATKALTSYCFNELGLNRVEIRVVPTNQKSRSIPERLGFTQEGVLRQNELLNGQYYDHMIFSMLKQEWLA